MDKRLRLPRAVKALKQLNGRTVGLLTLRSHLSIWVTSSDTAITTMLRTLNAIGVIEEVDQYQFKINTEINLENMKDIADLIEERTEEETPTFDINKMTEGIHGSRRTSETDEGP